MLQLGISPLAVVFFGQSNAITQDNVAGSVPGYLAVADSGIKIWTGSAFETLVNGHNNWTLPGAFYDSYWGPEAELAYRFRLSLGLPLYIIKYAVGGSTMASDWNPAGSNNAFTALETHITSAVAAVPGLKVIGCFMDQGETDATVQADADAYGANFATLRTAVKTRYRLGNNPFVLARTSYSGLTYLSTVRTAQQNAVDTITTYVDTDAYGTATLHYPTAGVIACGAAMYLAWGSLR